MQRRGSSNICGGRHLGDGLDSRKAPSVCPPPLDFREGLGKFGENDFDDMGPGAVVTERYVMGENGDWFFFLDDVRSFVTVC